MIHMNRPGLALLLASFMVPGLCHAVNWQWLDDAAVKSFSEKDWELLRNTARRALDQYPDHTKVEWSNPDNQHSGSIELLDTHRIDERVCRTTVIRNEAEGKTGTTRLNLCKQEDNSWKITPGKTPSGQ